VPPVAYQERFTLSPSTMVVRSAEKEKIVGADWGTDVGV
jgi:hypothetical protein